MKKLKRLLLLLLLLINGFSLFSQSLVSKARWTKTTVTIDGDAVEWETPLNFYDLKSRLIYGIANDSSALYICFQNPDERSQSKLFRCGMKINISIKKLKRSATLSYPLPQSGDENAGPGQTPDMEKLKTNFRIQNMMLEAEGFTSQNGMIPLSDSSVIKTGINWNSTNMMTYELAIPFTEIFGKDYNPQDLANEITLNVEVNAMPKPRNSSASTQAPLGAAGVMGARAMGGVDIQPNSGGKKSPWYQVQEFKQKFILSTRP